MDSSKTVRIPASLDEAISNLNGLAALLTAKQWERAAIVYAFTEPGNGQGARQPLMRSPERLSLVAFAKLGISGLRDQRRVAAYRSAWESAVDQGRAREVNAGDATTLPDLPWEDFFIDPAPTAVVQQSAFRAVVSDPERFREAIRDQPEAVINLAQRVVETPSVRPVVETRLAEPARERDYVPPPAPRPVDYSDDFRAAVNKLIPILHAIRDGRWEPDPADRALSAFLGRAFQEIVSGEPTAGLFSEIDAFLASRPSKACAGS